MPWFLTLVTADALRQSTDRGKEPNSTLLYMNSAWVEGVGVRKVTKRLCTLAGAGD